MSFISNFQNFLLDYSVGVHQVKINQAKSVDSIDFVLSDDYKTFLAHYTSVSLFQDFIEYFALTDQRCVKSAEGRFLAIGALSAGTLYLTKQGPIFWSSDEIFNPILIAETFSSHLTATCKREALLFDRDGEFNDVFDEDGEFLPKIQKKRIQVGLKYEPHSALYRYEAAELAIALGKNELAIADLEQAVSDDPQAGPCWQLLGSLYHKQNFLAEAERCFAQLAQATISDDDKVSALFYAAQLATNKAPYAKKILATFPQEFDSLLQQINQTLDKNAAIELLEKARLLLEFTADNTTEKVARFQAIEKRLKTRSALNVL